MGFNLLNNTPLMQSNHKKSLKFHENVMISKERTVFVS